MLAKVDFRFAFESWKECQPYMDAINVSDKWIYDPGDECACETFENRHIVQYDHASYVIIIVVCLNEMIWIKVCYGEDSYWNREKNSHTKYESILDTLMHYRLLRDLKANPTLKIVLKANEL